MMLDKQSRQALAHALKTLKPVEPRAWHDILLSSADPINEAGEAEKLVKIATCFRRFRQEFPRVDIPLWQEAYAVLRAAYNNQQFPQRQHLNRKQFGRLLDMQLDLF